MPMNHVTLDQITDTDKVQYITTTTRLSPRVRSVQASTVSGTGAISLYMPSAQEAPVGVPITIYMVARNSTNDITIVLSDGASDITLDAAGEYTVLMSDGNRYYELVSNHA